MSDQPSKVDDIRSTASSAAHNIAETIGPSNSGDNSSKKKKVITDVQGTSCEKGSFRDQLNKVAREGIREEQKGESLIEKAMSYIPGVSTSTPSGPEHDPKLESKDEDIHSEVVPKRPDHDLQVEEFLKEQYRSKNGPDMPKVGEDK